MDRFVKSLLLIALLLTSSCTYVTRDYYESQGAGLDSDASAPCSCSCTLQDATVEGSADATPEANPDSSSEATSDVSSEATSDVSSEVLESEVEVEAPLDSAVDTRVDGNTEASAEAGAVDSSTEASSMCGAAPPSGVLTGTPLTWTQASLPGYVAGDDCQSVVLDPVNPATIIVPCGNNDGRAIKWYRSLDFGETWALVNSTAMNGNPWGATGDPNPSRDPCTPLTIYSPAGYGSYGAWKSTDTGSTWTRLTGADTAFAPVNPFGPTDLYEVAVLPDDPPNHVLATYHYYFKGLADGGFGESTNGGATWTIHVPPTGIGTSHYVMPISGTTWDVIAQDNGGANGIWETTNSGSTWARVAGKDTWGDAEHAHGSFTPLSIRGVWYAPTWTSVWTRSTGGTWTDLLPEYYWASPPNPAFVGQRMSGLAATSTYVYSNLLAPAGPTIARAPIGSLASPSAWVTNYTTVPPTLNGNGSNPLGTAATYDAIAGHWLVLMTTNTGIWRMVE